jgi:hypothetical protein
MTESPPKASELPLSAPGGGNPQSRAHTGAVASPTAAAAAVAGVSKESPKTDAGAELGVSKESQKADGDEILGVSKESQKGRRPRQKGRSQSVQKWVQGV